MSGDASSSGSSRPVEPEVSRRPVGSELSNAGIIDMKEFPVVESLPCFDKGKVGAPQMVNLERVLLPTGESLSEFVANIHFMGEKLQPFMDFAVGADAELSERFSFREAGAQVARSQRDGSPGSSCAAACREMARLVILDNHRSLRTWEDEWVILPTVPGAAQPLLPGAPEPGTPTEAEGPVPDNIAYSLKDRASTSSDEGKERETVREERREGASEPQSGAGSGGGQPDPKRRRVDGTDQQAADLRTLLDGNRVTSLTPVPREVSLY